MPELSNQGSVMRELYYGLNREDIAKPEHIDEWDEDRFEAEVELQEFFDIVIQDPVTAQHIAQAARAIMQVWYGKYNPKFHPSHENAWITPAKALHAALIWDRG